MMNPVFSIVTPTYNRASLLSRVFSSLIQQTYTNFEWIIIDDGSTDNTESIVANMKNKAIFKIVYIKTHNQGKANALNKSLEHCKGLLYLVFDSDDWCDTNALKIFYDDYITLKNRSDFDEYCAISALKRYPSGGIVGDDYTSIEKYGLTYIDRINKNIQGDKWECLIFSKMQHLVYPVAENEKYMAPGYIWLQLAQDNLKTVYINKALSTIEYQPDGISKNSLRHRLNSINSTIRYYRFAYQLNKLSYIQAGKYYANYIRFCMHNKERGRFSKYYAMFYGLGIALYLKDKKIIKYLKQSY